jgi:hypothetical protein
MDIDKDIVARLRWASTIIRGAAWGCQPQLHPSTQVAPSELVRHQHARLSVSSSIASETANLLSAELTITLRG